MSQAPEEARLIRTAREVNENKPLWVVDKVKSLVDQLVQSGGKEAADIRIVCLGLAFKADIVLLLVDHKEWKGMVFQLRDDQRFLDTRGVIKSVPREQ